MRVLVIGGSGFVASLTLPLLKAKYDFRIYDRREPEFDPSLEFVRGDVGDFEAIRQASLGCDALLYMAMGRYIPIGTPYEENIDALVSSMEVNVKGVYLALNAASTAGVRHAVYTSSMSIYSEDNLYERYFPDEELTPDACDSYGFTKRMGELVCQNACRERGMSVNVLRLCFPRPDTDWAERVEAGKPTLLTAGSDVARALDSALQTQAGYQTFMVSGDYENRILNMSKAKRMLGWEPLARPKSADNWNEEITIPTD